MPDSRLYDMDWYAWTQEQAAALRRMVDARTNTELDLEHLAEEVELLGGSEINALDSALARVLEHLLKKILKRSGTIRRRLPDLMPDAWDEGRKLAAKALELYDDLDPASLPTDCPYTPDQILADDFYPANRHGLP